MLLAKDLTNVEITTSMAIGSEHFGGKASESRLAPLNIRIAEKCQEKQQK